MLVIGLTGGIASGKSAAAACFARLGIPVLDADQIARELVMPGQPLLQQIFAHFGAELRLPDGSLDRATLGQRIFADPALRHRLEAMLHPQIRAEMLRRLAELNSDYAILMAPLLVEAGLTEYVDRVLVIDAPEALQRSRSHQRDGHDTSHIDRIMAAQTDRQTRLSAADDVIINDGSLSALDEAVSQLHRRYLALAAETCPPR